MKKVILLLGPTGVGKTGMSLLLAKELETEIISADSMQIYRHMDIGTAKPSAEERKRIRHHMIDIAEPSEAYSAGRYLDDVAPIIESLCMMGKIPVIVGGTGLYIKAMTDGLFSGPSSDLDLRAKLQTMEDSSKGSLYAYLSRLDPEAAARIEQANIRRIMRAIEVCLSSGTTMSSMQKIHTRPLPYDFIRIGLTRERAELYQMIDQRTDAMFSAGLIEEVKSLVQMNPDRTPLQAIGYKEIIKYLNHEIDLREAERLIKRNSRRYAKRQFTWFNQDKAVRWIDVSGMKSPADIQKQVKQIMSDML